MTECAPTINAAAGMSGNNRPFVLLGCLHFQGGKGNNVFARDESSSRSAVQRPAAPAPSGTTYGQTKGEL